MRSRGPTVVLVGGLLAAVLLGGCGGGSSSTSGPTTSSGGSGGGGGGIVQGQIVSVQTAARRDPVTIVALRIALGIGLAEAAVGDPVAGVTVTLTGTGGTFSTVSAADGSFLFPNVPPGTYTIQVTDPRVTPTKVFIVSGTSGLTVGAGDTAVIAGTVTETSLATTVQVNATDFADVLANDAQTAHAINIASASHQSLDAVIAFRQAGHGWGQVAQHFGVHPSVLGLGASQDDVENVRGSRGRGKAKGKVKA